MEKSNTKLLLNLPLLPIKPERLLTKICLTSEGDTIIKKKLMFKNWVTLLMNITIITYSIKYQIVKINASKDN